MNTEMNATAPRAKPGVEAVPHAIEWRVWSDGACIPNPGPAGWAVLIETPGGESWTLHGNSKNSTNNRAEMYGLLQGVLAIPLETPATIKTDSRYVVDGCTLWRAGWQAKGMRMKTGPVKNADLWPGLWAALDARPQVRIEWVKGHSGERGNEIVDQIAEAAAERRRAGGRLRTGSAQTSPHRTSTTPEDNHRSPPSDLWVGFFTFRGASWSTCKSCWTEPPAS